MAEFYSARSWEIPPLPWTNLSPPFSLEGPGISVVDAPLFGRERMFERLDLDPVIAERTGLVEAEGLQIAGHHLHRRDPAGLHGG